MEKTLEQKVTVDTFFESIRINNSSTHILEKIPKQGPDGKVKLKVITTTDQPFPLNIEDDLRFRYSAKGAELGGIECRKVPRWMFMKYVSEWERELKTNLNFGIGNPDNAKEYFNNLLLLAGETRSSDIHLFPSYEGRKDVGSVQFRTDGVMVNVATLSRDQLAGLTSEAQRICENAAVEKNGERRVIEGCFPGTTKIGALETEYRVTSMSTGDESYATAIRLIKRSFLQSPLSKLNFMDQDILKIKDLLKCNSGFFAVVGPTGAGKTTTAYSLLYELGDMWKGTKRIITFENPVESRINNVTHVRVTNDPESKNLVDYTTALKYSLRLDPDVIFVGEALGPETGRCITDAAQTSHLYMMTMHAADAAKAIGRLGGWGIGPRVLNDTLLGIISQNLLRKSCPACSTDRQLSDRERRYFFPKEQIEASSYEKLKSLLSKKTIRESKEGKDHCGAYCPECQATGYFGRIPIVEVYTHSIDKNSIITKICQNDSEGDVEMQNLFLSGKFDPMGLNALYQMLNGNTTPSEIKRLFPPRYYQTYAPIIAKKVIEYLEVPGSNGDGAGTIETTMRIRK